MQLLKKEKKFE
jgi:RNase H-like domain found in reverse transcriptase/Integrase zinc binding domain